MATVALDGSGAFGVKTRTVSRSAQVTLPATAARAIETAKARAVLRRSIGWVKRTEIMASRATFFALVVGRKRTTAGPAPVRTARTIVSSGAPSVSRTPETTSRYVVSGWSGTAGTKR